MLTVIATDIRFYPLRRLSTDASSIESLPQQNW
jgi:hypothetical protein